MNEVNLNRLNGSNVLQIDTKPLIDHTNIIIEIMMYFRWHSLRSHFCLKVLKYLYCGKFINLISSINIYGRDPRIRVSFGLGKLL